MAGRIALYPPALHSSLKPTPGAGLSHVMVVHGGIPPDYPDSSLLPFPKKLEEDTSDLFKSLDSLGKTTYANIRPPEFTPKTKRLFYGPAMYRGWAKHTSDDGKSYTEKEWEQVCKDAEKLLMKTNTRRMILGHTIHRKVGPSTESHLIASLTHRMPADY